MQAAQEVSSSDASASPVALDSLAEFHQKDPDNLPGVPLTSRTYRPPPEGCRAFFGLYYFIAFRAGHLNPDSPDRVVINVPELMAGLKRSKRWVYRGFHTLAAFGLLYSTPIGVDEGLDRRRHRTRLWLRAHANVPSALTAAALQRIAGPEDEDGAGPFPVDAEWVGNSHLKPRQAAAHAVARARRAASPPDDPDSGTALAASAEAPSSTNETPGATVAPSAVAPSAPPAAPPAKPARPRYDYPPHLLDAILPVDSAAVLRELFFRVAARLGLPANNPTVVCKVALDEPHGIRIIEQDPKFRARAAARLAYRARFGPDADLPIDPLPERSDFIPPDSKDFQPGRAGWRYVAGCWHAPAAVCRCTSKEVAAAIARMVLQPAVASG